ncbi:MAG: radical SAM protein [Chloroflexi bacterium]|nr:MAG: radical SAM protein [Chloroflexota bacterium]
MIDKAWAAGIPHLIFTGGEPTLRDDLIELLRFAEDRGQVTGLISDGLRMSEPDYLESLLQSGLDHMMMIFNPANEESWKALGSIIPADLYTNVHLTVTPENLPEITSLFRKLYDQGVRSISLSASDLSTRMVLTALRDVAADIGLSLVWDLPVPYSASNPISVEIEDNEETVEGAGQAWLYVEPDGDVLPAQGVNRILGNMLTDDWGVIKKSLTG